MSCVLPLSAAVVVSSCLLCSCALGALSAEVKDVNGAPTLLIDGKPVPPLIFFGSRVGRVPTMQVSGQWREYHATFVAPEDENGDVSFHIRFGDAKGDLWIDDVRLYPGEPADKPTGDMIKGGRFDDGLAGFKDCWNLFVKTEIGASAEPEIVVDPENPGNKCLRVGVSRPGDSYWHVHLYQAGMNIRKGQAYTLSARLRAAPDRKVEFLCVHQGEPWTHYNTEMAVWHEITMAARRGFHIHSVEISTPWPPDGQMPDYSPVDDVMRKVLASDPDALVIPRLGMAAPGWWMGKNPDDVMRYEDGTTIQNSVASEKWRRDACAVLRGLVRHMETRWGGHVIGYHPCGQNTGEWFYEASWEPKFSGFCPAMEIGFRKWIREVCNNDIQILNKRWLVSYDSFDQVRVPARAERMEAAFGEFHNPHKECLSIDFCRYQQIAMVEPLEAFARTIKEETRGRKLTVFFYGYIYDMSGLPLGPKISGHLELRRFLRSPDVDIVCSPISYFDRESGGSGPFMSAIDSVRLAGKLWLNEDDTRTHISEPDAGFGRVATADETRWVHQRNFGNIFVRRSSCWYMDLSGTGWLESETIWNDLHKLRNICETEMSKNPVYRPEVAIIVDEESLLYLKPGRKVALPLIYEFRRQVNRMGASTGIYLLEDLLAGTVPAAKAYLFLNAFKLTQKERTRLRGILEDCGGTAFWFYAPGYLDDETADVGFMKELTGFDFEILDKPIQPVLKPDDGEKSLRERLGNSRLIGVEVENGLSPIFAVKQNEDVRVLARYCQNNLPGMALRENGKWRSIYVGSPDAPATVLRCLLSECGVHVWLDSDDVVATNGEFLFVHASSSGMKEIHFPQNCDVHDALTEEIIAKSAVAIRLEMVKGETRMLRLSDGRR
ncbi:MAG TPA: beta-galactosidase [Candidatus Brocadiia bacterium]|nr:beta-galactosidase [Candidatus Brocadiia bacterium]